MGHMHSTLQDQPIPVSGRKRPKEEQNCSMVWSIRYISDNVGNLMFVDVSRHILCGEMEQKICTAP